MIWKVFHHHWLLHAILNLWVTLKFQHKYQSQITLIVSSKPLAYTLRIWTVFHQCGSVHTFTAIAFWSTIITSTSTILYCWGSQLGKYKCSYIMGLSISVMVVTIASITFLICDYIPMYLKNMTTKNTIQSLQEWNYQSHISV